MKNYCVIIFFFYLLISNTFAQTEADEALLLHLDFNQETLVDNSKHGHTIVDHSTSFGEGIEQDGLFLEGTDNYLEISHATTLEIPDQVTTSVWYKHQSQPSGTFYPLVEQSADVFGGHSRYGSWVFQGSRIQTCIEPDICPDGAALCQRCVSSSPFLENEMWYHIVSLYDGTNLQIYVNGKLIAERSFMPSTGISVLPFPMTIGYDMYGAGSDYLTGNLDEVKVFSTALSKEDIIQLYLDFVTTNTFDKAKDHIAVFPNPASDVIFIESPIAFKEIKIFNVNGEMIAMEKGTVTSMNISNLNSGWYFFHLVGEVSSYLKRIYVTR